jgi:hypothetical protein
MAVEIYPRWLTGRVSKTNEISRRVFLAIHAGEEDRALVEIAASNEHAFDAAASVLAMARDARTLVEPGAVPGPEASLEGRIWSPRGPVLRPLEGSPIV